MILQALGAGLSLLKCHKKAVLYGYLLNLVMACLLLLPFMETFDESLGPGLYRQQMVDQIDYDWYYGYREKVTGFASSFSPWVSGPGPFIHSLEGLLGGGLVELPWAILGLGGLYLLLNSFMTAAAVGSFALDPGGTSSREFLRTGAAYLGRFLRLSLLALLMFWAAGHWIMKPLAEVLRPMLEDATSERTAFLWNVGLHLAGLPALLFLNLLFDYAKIKTAAEDRTSSLLALLSALTFCRQHLFSVSVLYLILAGLGVAGMGVYTVVDAVLPQDRGWTILLALVCQQAFMVGRILLKLLFYSGQMQLYQVADN